MQWGAIFASFAKLFADDVWAVYGIEAKHAMKTSVRFALDTHINSELKRLHVTGAQ
jgi:hypothetical protein